MAFKISRSDMKKIIVIIILACVAGYFLLFHQSSPLKVKGPRWSLKNAVDKRVGNYRCPAPNLVGYYQRKVGGFKDQRLDWTVDNINMLVGTDLRFSQAVFLSTQNDFKCNYEWPNPQNPGTWIVVTVHLIPNAALKVDIKGEHWRDEGISKICESHDVKTCTFDLVRKKYN